MKMNNRFIYGIISIVLAVIIAFIAIPAITGKTSNTYEIVRMKTFVDSGRAITAEDVELVEVGEYMSPEPWKTLWEPMLQPAFIPEIIFFQKK